MKVKKFQELLNEVQTETDIINNVEVKNGSFEEDLEELLQGLTLSVFKKKVRDIKPLMVKGVLGDTSQSALTNQLEITQSNRDKINLTYTRYKDHVHISLIINDEDIIYRTKDVMAESDYPFSKFVETIIRAYRFNLMAKDYKVLESDQKGSKEELEIHDEAGDKLDPKDWQISKILAIHTEPEAKLETDVKEGIANVPLQTDLEVKDVKRGDILYITAFLKSKTPTSSFTPGKLGVLKCRIIDLYYNLNILRNLKQ